MADAFLLGSSFIVILLSKEGLRKLAVVERVYLLLYNFLSVSQEYSLRQVLYLVNDPLSTKLDCQCTRMELLLQRPLRRLARCHQLQPLDLLPICFLAFTDICQQLLVSCLLISLSWSLLQRNISHRNLSKFKWPASNYLNISSHLLNN